MRRSAVIAIIVCLLTGACSTRATDADTANSNAPQDAAGAQDALAAGDTGVVAAPAEQSASVPGGVTVSGAGEAAGTPDVVLVTVGVEVEHEAVQAAIEQANAATERVLSTLDDAGVAADDRQTREFSVRPVRRGPADGGEPSISGYAVVNLVEVTVRDVSRVGEILGAVVEAGGDDVRIENVRFDLEQDGEQIAAARQAAFEDARMAAEQYAQLAGRSLGPLIGIEDVTVGSPRPATSADLGAAAEAAVPVAPGEQQIVVRIVGRWGLE